MLVYSDGPIDGQGVGMHITEVRIRPVEADEKLRAYVTVTFDQCFVVHNMKVIAGVEGLFVAMPSRRVRSGEFRDVVHPITSSFREELEDRILEAYRERLAEPNGTSPSG